jgi:hypothetical protein
MYHLKRIPRAFQRLCDAAVHRAQPPVLGDELDGVRVPVEHLDGLGIACGGGDVLHLTGLGVAANFLQILDGDSDTGDPDGDDMVSGEGGNDRIRSLDEGDEHPLLAPAPGLRDTAPGRRGVDRGSRPGPVVPGSRVRGPRERLHEQEHDVHDLEPDARGADDKGRWGHPCLREPEVRVGGRLPS